MLDSKSADPKNKLEKKIKIIESVTEHGTRTQPFIYTDISYYC